MLILVLVLVLVLILVLVLVLILVLVLEVAPWCSEAFLRSSRDFWRGVACSSRFVFDSEP